MSAAALNRQLASLRQQISATAELRTVAHAQAEILLQREPQLLQTLPDDERLAYNA